MAFTQTFKKHLGKLFPVYADPGSVAGENGAIIVRQSDGKIFWWDTAYTNPDYAGQPGENWRPLDIASADANDLPIVIVDSSATSNSSNHTYSGFEDAFQYEGDGRLYWVKNGTDFTVNVDNLIANGKEIPSEITLMMNGQDHVSINFVGTDTTNNTGASTKYQISNWSFNGTFIIAVGQADSDVYLNGLTGSFYEFVPGQDTGGNDIKLNEVHVDSCHGTFKIGNADLISDTAYIGTVVMGVDSNPYEVTANTVKFYSVSAGTAGTGRTEIGTLATAKLIVDNAIADYYVSEFSLIPSPVSVEHAIELISSTIESAGSVTIETVDTLTSTPNLSTANNGYTSFIYLKDSGSGGSVKTSLAIKGGETTLNALGVTSPIPIMSGDAGITFEGNFYYRHFDWGTAFDFQTAADDAAAKTAAPFRARFTGGEITLDFPEGKPVKVTAISDGAGGYYKYFALFEEDLFGGVDVKFDNLYIDYRDASGATLDDIYLLINLEGATNDIDVKEMWIKNGAAPYFQRAYVILDNNTPSKLMLSHAMLETPYDSGATAEANLIYYLVLSGAYSSFEGKRVDIQYYDTSSSSWNSTGNTHYFSLGNDTKLSFTHCNVKFVGMDPHFDMSLGGLATDNNITVTDVNNITLNSGAARNIFVHSRWSGTLTDNSGYAVGSADENKYYKYTNRGTGVVDPVSLASMQTVADSANDASTLIGDIANNSATGYYSIAAGTEITNVDDLTFMFGSNQLYKAFKPVATQVTEGGTAATLSIDGTETFTIRLPFPTTGEGVGTYKFKLNGTVSYNNQQTSFSYDVSMYIDSTGAITINNEYTTIEHNELGLDTLTLDISATSVDTANNYVNVVITVAVTDADNSGATMVAAGMLEIAKLQ